MKANLSSDAMDRRSWLKSLGVTAAGVALLDEAVSGADNASANVEDRTASIRITSLEPNVCGDRIFLKIGTNHGVFGWGEIKGVIPSVAARLARSMFELIQGENPTRIEYIWQRLFRGHRNLRGGAFMIHCISGIDNALWDITGKLWGVPVYRLLGGPVRDRIRIYPSKKAVKLGTGPKRHVGDPADVQDLVNQVRQARERLGPDGTVMFDAHSALPHTLALQFASAIEHYDLLFLEEPAVPGNVEVFKMLRNEMKVPLATGERVRTIWEVLPYLTEGAVDILQPDSGYTGGISQFVKIATLAESYYVPLAPHCTQSYLGATASFHASATVPFLLIHEVYDFEPFTRIVKKTWEKTEDGYVTLPQGPGLGVDIDEKALAEIAATTSTRFDWPRRSTLPDGSVADY